jgi:hypothetical protein
MPLCGERVYYRKRGGEANKKYSRPPNRILSFRRSFPEQAGRLVPDPVFEFRIFIPGNLPYPENTPSKRFHPFPFYGIVSSLQERKSRIFSRKKKSSQETHEHDIV